MDANPTRDCSICQKHRGVGPLTGQLVGRYDGFWIYHGPVDDDGHAPLGWLFIEAGRHVPYVWALSDQEAAKLGLLRTRLARAVRDILSAEYVLTFVIGLGVAHFHEHVVPRMPGTPADVPWFEGSQVLSKADANTVGVLVAQLREALVD